jgi:3-phenylpropionate/trans-cinnamate dioxygenase ferredoxin subunit
MVVCQVDGVDVLLCCIGEEYFAVADQCSHARQALSKGKLRGYQITCPLHGARFDVRDGRCLAKPATRPIASYAVTVRDGHVYVGVD